MRFVLYDRWGTRKGDLAGLRSAKQTRGVDGSDSLELTLGTTGIVPAKGDRIVLAEDGTYREYEVTSPRLTRSSTRPDLSVVAQTSLLELDSVFLRRLWLANYTVEGAVRKALEGTRWTLGTVETDGYSNWNSLYTTPLRLIQNVCEAYGLELMTTFEKASDGLGIGVRRIDLVKAQGQADSTNPPRFEYSRNLPSVKQTISADTPKTRVYAYGAVLANSNAATEGEIGYGERLTFASINDGKEFVEDAPATELWGIPDATGTKQPAAAVLIDSSCDSANTLLAEAKAALDKSKTPVVTYEADVTTFALDASLGDRVLVLDETFSPKLVVDGRVLKTERDLLDPSNTRLTLGNLTKTLTQSAKAEQQKLDQLIEDSGLWSSSAKDLLTGTQDGFSALGASCNIGVSGKSLDAGKDYQTIGPEGTFTPTITGWTGSVRPGDDGSIFELADLGLKVRKAGWYTLEGAAQIRTPGPWLTTETLVEEVDATFYVVKSDGSSEALAGPGAVFTKSDGELNMITKGMASASTWLDAGDTVQIHYECTVTPPSLDPRNVLIGRRSWLRVFKVPYGNLK